eukprot:3295041-Prymnesium_polylepis.2
MPERREFNPFLDNYQEMSNIAASYALIFITESATGVRGRTLWFATSSSAIFLLTVFICVVKSLKFFALQKDLMLLQMTLGQAFKDLLVFVAMTIILFVGFVVMGLNIFGMQVQMRRAQRCSQRLCLQTFAPFRRRPTIQLSTHWAHCF